MIIDLVPLWAFIVAFAVILYVLLDGFDLGVAMVYGLASDRKTRSIIMDSIAPIWDGNETWLVLGGLSLLAAFPRAFSVLMPAVYFPILLLLLGLIFRGVAFEFHYRDREHRNFWDHAFCYGSYIASFAQGIILGAFIEGFKLVNGQFVGSSWDCFTPFSVFTGFALALGYGLLGSGWLILKTEGEVQALARKQGKRCFLAVIGAMIIVTLWTPIIHPEILDRWLSWPNVFYLAPVPLLTAAVVFITWQAFKGNNELLPFVGSIALFLLSYFGIAISIYPKIIYPQMSLWDAASSPDTQIFLLIGTVFLLPIIAMYSAWSYWVFRGKIRADVGYH